MPIDATYLPRLQATIAALRYWIPAISDAARITVSEDGGNWQLVALPHQTGACPFTLTLTRQQTYSLTIADTSYPDLEVDSLALFQPLVAAIAEGHVHERRWSSLNTGVEVEVETIVDLGADRTWRGSSRLSGIDADLSNGPCIWRPRHFLPYRRR